MAANPRAGQQAQPEDLIDVAQVVTAYYTVEPDPDNVDQQVAFGTSGHRGSSLDAAFNEAHILATTQAIVEYRAEQGTSGPLFIGRDTHALSEPAWASALEVLAANDVVAMVDSADRYTPTPAVSHAILAFNRGRDGDLADGIVVTPSHNPPRDGGFKYNPPNGGPADTDATGVIAETGQRDPARRAQGREADTAGPGTAERAASRLHGRLRRRPAERGRRARHSCREDPHRRRPAGRGQRRLLGGDRRAAQPRADGGQPAGRRHVAVHDSRHRRQDPDGLQFAQRDGVADRQPRVVPDRRPATTPTPTGTASSRPTAVCSTRTTTSRWRSSTCTPTGRSGPRRRPSARPRSARRSSTGSSPDWAASCSRCRSGSSGSSTG